MADSTSKTSKNGQANPNDYEGFLTRFGSLRVGKDGVLKGQPATQNPEKDVIDEEQTKRRSDQMLAAQEIHEGFSRNPVSDHGNIWGYQNSNNLGNMNSGLGIFTGSVNFNDKHIDSSYLSENLGGSRSSSGQRGTNFFYGSSSTSNPANQYNRIPIWHDQIRGIENPGLFSPNEYFKLNNYNQRSFCRLSNQNGSNFYSNAGMQIGSKDLQRENIQGTGITDTVLLDSIFHLMTHERRHVLFEELIDSCTVNELHSIVSKLCSNIKLFIDAAFCRIGSNSIQKLIKKLKKTPYANTMTKILSSRYYLIMTHEFARHVILQCLNLLDRKSNEILYEYAIYYFQDLARHEVGCRSLNECINSIAGNQRDTLLNRIADVSDFLANDPYGNYVVQHVLELRNNVITKKILCYLQGQFIQLSKTKGGSHVVEKCIETSKFGSSWVVKEIIDCPKTTVRLAQHHFGNFVIQKALLRTKIEKQMHLHEPLVTILEQGSDDLEQTKCGKFVLALLKELQEA
ncbi:putative pumilio8 [Abeliophyllum distichum]|uniref:Pumilio8 n=1 Tax=Abeliophyllum distichum TaxID=126358 RepID=A0ABD1QIZ6_9LAMI